MATLPALMTVEEFQELPLDRGPVMHELHHGEVVTLTRPKAKHYSLQKRLEHLLEARAGHLGDVGIEMPFRAVPQFDLRAADVAFVSQDRWNAIDPNDNLRGAPEMVIEVKSALNTWAELRERASLCLANGCQDFWIVDEKTRTVTTINREGKVTKYSAADCVPLPLFDDEGLRLADIFD